MKLKRIQPKQPKSLDYSYDYDYGDCVRVRVCVCVWMSVCVGVCCGLCTLCCTISALFSDNNIFIRLFALWAELWIVRPVNKCDPVRDDDDVKDVAVAEK